ncbi:hypothetical protein LY78DRAFT_335546 [Colletotrichum sublineola]|nr:hypothetical protein LY78DRAFT_335546 [Colletotrichum sublineola]
MDTWTIHSLPWFLSIRGYGRGLTGDLSPSCVAARSLGLSACHHGPRSNVHQALKLKRTDHLAPRRHVQGLQFQSFKSTPRAPPPCCPTSRLPVRHRFTLRPQMPAKCRSRRHSLCYHRAMTSFVALANHPASLFCLSQRLQSVRGGKHSAMHLKESRPLVSSMPTRLSCYASFQSQWCDTTTALESDSITREHLCVYVTVCVCP